MRVIGGHDYYDRAAAHGTDMTRVFQRGQTDPLPVDQFPAKFRDLELHIREVGARGWASRWRHEPLPGDPARNGVLNVWFCGELRVAPVIGGFVCWELIHLRDHLEGLGFEHVDEKSKWDKTKVLDSEVMADHGSAADRKALVEAGIVCASRFVPETLKYKNRRDVLWRINEANMSEWQLFRIYDPWQAFQKIDVFLGEVRSPEREMVAISDKVRAEKHGMDKTSFRKPPSKR